MKFFSRSTFGIVVGAINVCFFALLIVYVTALKFNVSGLPKEGLPIRTGLLTRSDALLYITLLICIVSLITSVLLVWGIIKQRHSLMQPWICSAVIGIAFYTFRKVVRIVVGFLVDASWGLIFATLFADLLMFGLQFLIFYPIYTLYTDFRDAASALEQQPLNNLPQSPPNYAELEKGGQMYN